MGQTAAFTYQGRLSDNGVPANGLYDLQFAIFDSASGGTAISGLLTNRDLGITNGLFTVTLDFGAEIFDGNARWLEIAARTNGAISFVTLTPRQMLTPAPTAIFAGTAATALSVSGAIPTGSLIGTYGGAVNFSNAANSFSGDGAGLVNVAGTLPSQAIASNAVQALPNTSYVLTNAQPVTVTLPPAPKVGDVLRVAGTGAGGWILAQNPGQSILGINLVNPLTPWMKIPGATAGQGQSIACSADGSHLIAGYAGYLYLSVDSATTWFTPPNQPLGNGFQFSISSDGHYAAGVLSGRYIYVSADFGTNWIAQTNSVITNYSGIAMSADGSRLVAVVNGGGIYLSTDFGTNWTLTSAPSNTWVAVSSSADGSRLTAAAYASGIYYSTNFGTNWHLSAGPGTNVWAALTSSADGNRVVAVGTLANAWFSTDAGQNWQSSPIVSAAYNSVACSADGLHLAASAGNIISISTDGGLNWLTSHAPVASWHGMASSAAGNFFANGIFTGIYTFKNATSTGTNGYLSGEAFAAVELEYVGNGQFLPISHEGAIFTR